MWPMGQMFSSKQSRALTFMGIMRRVNHGCAFAAKMPDTGTPVRSRTESDINLAAFHARAQAGLEGFSSKSLSKSQ